MAGLDSFEHILFFLPRRRDGQHDSFPFVVQGLSNDGLGVQEHFANLPNQNPEWLSLSQSVHDQISGPLNQHFSLPHMNLLGCLARESLGHGDQ